MKKFFLSILIVFLMTFSVNAEIGTDGSIGKDPSSGSGDVATDTIFDAVGDLVQGSGSDTAARLAIGSAGTLLQSTGSAAAWATTLTGAYTFNKVNAASGSATVLQYTGTLGIMNGSDIFKLLAIDIINADHTGASNYVEGISIGSITGDADASEYGYYIGTGWDYGLWSGSNVFVRNGTAGGALHLGEGSGGGSNYIGLKAPDALAGDTVYTLPTAFPAGAAYLLNSGATGTMGFTDPASFQAAGSYQTDMGITAKSDSTSTTSSTSVASSTAVKAAYDLANAAIPKNTIAAAGDIIVGSGAGAVTVITKGAINSLLGVNGAGTLGYYTSISIDDSAAQFYSAIASKGTLKNLLSGSTSGKLLTVSWNHTDNATLNFPMPTTGDSVTYSSAPIRINTGATTARVITAPDANVTIPANPIGGTLGATTNIIPKASGTGTATLQASGITEDGTNVDIGGLNLLTTGTISGKFVVVNGGAADLNLTVAQVKGTVISNTGQGPNNRNHTLPVAEAGLFFLGTVGEAQAASYYRFTANTTPTPDDFMCLDGTCGKTYVSIAAPTQGAQVACHTEQIASTGIVTGAALGIGTTNTNVANGAFTFDVAGTGYAKAATAAGTAFNAITTVQNKYGAQAFDIGVNGTIDVISGTNIATGFNTPAEAAADLPAVASAHVRMGYVTVMRSNIAGFVWGTTALDDAETTEAYTSSGAYTKPYNWLCNKSVGTWVTN